MTTYQLTSGTSIIRTSDNANIPADPANSDYQAYLAWVAAGNTPTPVPAITLAQAQATQLATLASSYQAAILKNVSYTSKAGVAKTYQADPSSVSNLQASLLGCQSTQATPPGFFWVASDNTQVPFTFADLQGLAAVIFAQGAAAFARYQNQKMAINAATTVAAVQAITF
jgi:Domain of unknown function (DUF4376)